MLKSQQSWFNPSIVRRKVESERRHMKQCWIKYIKNKLKFLFSILHFCRKKVTFVDFINVLNCARTVLFTHGFQKSLSRLWAVLGDGSNNRFWTCFAAAGLPARGGAGLRAGLSPAGLHPRQLHAARGPSSRDDDDLLDQLYHLWVSGVGEGAEKWREISISFGGKFVLFLRENMNVLAKYSRIWPNI